MVSPFFVTNGKDNCFSRGTQLSSPCATLRAQGGTLCKKNLKENRFGECDLWEKHMI